MLRRTLKIAWYNRSRYSLTLLAIALAVAFIVATLLLTFSISNVGGPLTAAYDDVDVVVAGPEVAEAAGPAGATIAPVDPATLVTLSDAGIEVVGILGSTPEKSNSAAAKLGLSCGYDSLDSLLSDSNVDVVHITSPNRFHFVQASRTTSPLGRSDRRMEDSRSSLRQR